MNTNKCPKCHAPYNGLKCDYCGYVKKDIEDYKATEEKTEVKEESYLDKFLSSKIDFMTPAVQLKLAFAYLNGVNCTKDEKKATELFYKAASSGNVEAIFQYAESLYYGRGIEKDLNRALIYYKQAASMKHVGAKTRLKEIDISVEKQTSSVVSLPASTAVSLSFEQVVAKIKPYCVEILCCIDKKPVSQGSGFIIENGLIITNAHVVQDPTVQECKPITEVYLSFDLSLDQNAYPIQVIAMDAKEDIALCFFSLGIPEQLTASPNIINVAHYPIGKEVFTIGNGLGRGLGLSKGVISRDIERNYANHSEVIRTDMSINPGNSGGALFDSNGNIIGMMTFGAVQSDESIAYGMSYAITSNTIIKFIETILQEIKELK